VAEFQYIALDRVGKRVEGRVEAGSRAEAMEKVSAGPLQLLKLADAKGSGAANSGTKKTKAAEAPVKLRKLRPAEIVEFTEDLADMLEAGQPLEQVLALIERRHGNPIVRGWMKTMRLLLCDGASFSASLRTSDAGFDQHYISVAEAGEISGQLAPMLRRQAKYLATMREMQSRVTGALIYPAFLVVAGFGLVILFILVLLPQLVSLFAKTGGALPMATRLLIDLSEWGGKAWPYVLGLIILSIATWIVAMREEKARMWWGKMQLKIPLLGSILRLRMEVRLVHTLGDLLENGIPLNSALRLASRSLTNPYLREGTLAILADVEEGSGISSSLRRRALFSSEIADIAAVGEQTGGLGHAFQRLAIRLEKRLEERLRRLAALVEPLVILCIAVFVGLIAYAVFMGIFQSISGLRKQY